MENSFPLTRVEFNLIARDQSTIFKILPREVAPRITIVPNDAFKEVRGEGFEVICRTKIFFVKERDGIMVTSEAWASMAQLPQHLDTGKHLVAVIKLPSSKIQTILPKEYEKFAKLFDEHFDSAELKERYISSDSLHLKDWLHMLCIYPEFELCYEAYRADPDYNVIFNNDKPGMKLGEQDPSAGGRKYTKEDVKASIHIAMLCIHKTFGERTKQLENFVATSLKAIKIQLSTSEARLCYSKEFLKKFCLTMRMYPKLKKQLFYFHYTHRSDYREFGTTMTLWANSEMAVVDEMLQFIRSKQQCLAHMQVEVIRDVAKFLPLVEEKREAHGALWPFYRFLNPNDAKINVFNFPNLATVAIALAKHRNPESYRNYGFQVPNCTLSDVSRLVQTETLSDAARRLGLNIDGWSAGQQPGAPKEG